MITTRKIKDGQYNVYESNKLIGTVFFNRDRDSGGILQKIYTMEIPKYNILHGVAMTIKNFKNIERSAVNILVRWLKEVAKVNIKKGAI